MAMCPYEKSARITLKKPLTRLSGFVGSPPSPLGRGCPRYEGG
jgi:hypothetical protein